MRKYSDDDIFFYGNYKIYNNNVFQYAEEEENEINETSYNKNRDLNIIGRVALIQINITNDIKVFCDKKYDNTCVKSKGGKCLTCGEGTFYDVENANEITQFLIGENYYFDKNKKVFIKCHKRCKNCEKEYSLTNMECLECLNTTSFYLRDGNCLEKPNFIYNF